MTNQVERFGECAILELKTTGFEQLSLNKKQLVYHLSEAGLYGRNIFLQQNHEHNLTVKNVMEELYTLLTEKQHKSDEFDRFTLYLKKFWIHVGIYHGMDNKRLDVDITQFEFKNLLSLVDMQSAVEDIEITQKVLFNSSFTKPLKNIQQSGIDVVAESGGNFYKNLTSKEVVQFQEEQNNSRKILSSFNEHEKPQYGFNTRLVKYKTGEIKEEVICKDGLYGSLVVKIIHHLEKAMSFVENKKQAESIKSLVAFYETGSAEDFDAHSLAWVQDKESEIFFINGLIESYDDPKGIRCTFESLVSFKNPKETAKVNKIIENIQWFEQNMPVDKEFKKEKASGLSASSVTVASMAGATSPSLPLGICLPNSDWIREKHGSKSVNLFNVENARGQSDDGVKEEFYLPEYQDVITRYASMSGSLHTDLHEVAGHGSCRSNDGVSNDSLDIFYSVIEESRADLVGLYYIGEQELVDYGIIDSDVNLEEFALAAYVKYLTNGSMLQLKRVGYGDDLAQPHLRNRQLIANWVIQNDNKNAVSTYKEKATGKTYVKVNDIKELRILFGQLLFEIQRIKSTGDFDAAKEIIETYATKVNKELHAEVIDRFDELNTPSTYGFTTPLYKKIEDKNGEVLDIEIYRKPSFALDQLYLSTTYK